MKIRPMVPSDHPQLIQLFKITPGVTLRDADSKEATERYLIRNPGLSFVAEDIPEESPEKSTKNSRKVQADIIGCVMCGHDGRRGYLQHLIVNPSHRRLGLGEKLFTNCLDALERAGIDKTHIFVFKDNGIANAFWVSKGWVLREGVNLYSYTRSGRDTA